MKERLKELLNEVISGVGLPSQNRHVYGLDGIAKLFNCSRSTAYRIKKSGIIKDATIQYGRKIIVDVDLALELLKEQAQGGRKYKK